MSRPPPRTTLLPYTTLFRSHRRSLRLRPRRTIPRARRPLSLQRALGGGAPRAGLSRGGCELSRPEAARGALDLPRSEEHTSELQSPDHVVCRLLLEKKDS